MSLQTPEKLRKLREALYGKDKQDPVCRFHRLYDKVWRGDVVAHAWALSRHNGGAPGVDGQTFDDIEAYGVERWLAELREEVRTGRYQPQPVRRVMIPKSSGVGQRPLGIPTIRDRPRPPTPPTAVARTARPCWRSTTATASASVAATCRPR